MFTFLPMLLATCFQPGEASSKTPWFARTSVVDFVDPLRSIHPPTGPRTFDRARATSKGIVLEPIGFDEAGAATLALTVHAEGAFLEALPSWNVVVPPGSGFVAELRVLREEGGERSPWLRVGSWGDVPGLPPAASFDSAHIDVDHLVATHAFDEVELRLRAFCQPGLGSQLIVERVAVSVRDRTKTAEQVARDFAAKHGSKAGCTLGGPNGPASRPASAAVDWPVPFRSQKTAPPELQSRVCSPTSVAMLLAYRGVTPPIADVRSRLYDAEHDLYGNWTRAIQGAFSFGVPGYVACFSDWNDVESSLAEGRPLAISIAAEKGALSGAPYEKTGGHLLVLRGFDAKGDCLVNDPAAVDAEHGRLTYSRAELEHCWFDHGGVAYVLLPTAADPRMPKASK